MSVIATLPNVSNHSILTKKPLKLRRWKISSLKAASIHKHMDHG